MLPEDRDAAHLWNMLLAGEDAQGVTEGITFEDLATSRTLQLALSKAVELIGEDARKLSPSFIAAHPEVPWPKIVGMRHRIVHDYRRLNLAMLWEVATEEVPPLVEQLKKWVADAEARRRATSGDSGN